MVMTNLAWGRGWQFFRYNCRTGISYHRDRGKGRQVIWGKLGAVRRRQSSSSARSNPGFVYIQPIPIAKFCRGLLQIWRDLGMMRSDIDKKKFDQGQEQEQEQVRGDDPRDDYGIDVANDTRDIRYGCALAYTVTMTAPLHYYLVDFDTTCIRNYLP
ncbi:uncharacterized protein EAF01_005037 [Botrytis porri]|uniref:uncharacterized protein n=1 Tax=Botrytis porri TaxID=87229 RepID=UPI0019002932|nr:uncharacterized protein EAF01_005037 [Botrytis porri]KAF7907451.1 hypothetical protein EAF01_005037 [Botrytis porri]